MRMVCQAQGCAWFEGFFVLFLLLTPNVDGSSLSSLLLWAGKGRRQERGRVLVPGTRALQRAGAVVSRNPELGIGRVRGSTFTGVAKPREQLIHGTSRDTSPGEMGVRAGTG